MAWLDANGSTIATLLNSQIYLNPVRSLGDTQIGLAYGDVTSHLNAVVTEVTAFLDEQGGLPLPGGRPENRGSADKCIDDALKEHLREEYITTHANKVPSCSNFVNALPYGVSSPFYVFGTADSNNVKKGTWIEDDTYDWALLSPALFAAVTSTMQQAVQQAIVDNPLPMRSGYRNPKSPLSLLPPTYDAHVLGLAGDFSISPINYDMTSWTRLQAIAKDQVTAAAISNYKAVACVEPWALMTSRKHLHIDVVTTPTCGPIHGPGW